MTQATPVSITQSPLQTGTLTAGSGNAPAGTVLSVTSASIPQQKIITATITNSNARLSPAQLAAYKQQLLLRQQNAAKQAGTIQQQIVNTQNTQQTTSISAQNIVRPTTSGQPTKISDIQIIQARNAPRVQTTIQQPSSQQIQIASLTGKPTSTAVMSTAGLPSMAVPIGTNQHQKILTTRSSQIYARKPTEEELEQFLSNRNAQKNQPNIVTSATVVQQSGAQPTTISTTTSSQQPQTTQQSGSISLPTLAQVQFLHIPSASPNQQISKEGTSGPGTAYLIYSSKGNTK